MEVTLLECEKVLATLPVSFYLGRDVGIEMDPKGDVSYYNPVADEIKISFNNIHNIMTNLNDENESAEPAIRALQYHEVSHALLTPGDLYGKENSFNRDLINVFEDERIETLLKDFYYGVDFKRNVFLMNNYQGQEPTNAFEAFYFLTRFRIGKEKLLKQVQYIIDEFADIINEKSSDGRSTVDYWRVDKYRERIINLFKQVAKEFFEDNKKEDLDSASKSKFGKSYDSLDEGKKEEIINDMLRKERTEHEGGGYLIFGSFDGEKSEEEKSENKDKAPGKIMDISDLPKEIQEKIEEAIAEAEAAQETENNYPPVNRDKLKTHVSTNKTDKSQKMLNTILNKNVDNELTKNIAEIFEQFTAREKNNGSSVNRYSGVLNPRNLVRKDWRLWEYKSQNGPIKGFDKLHLNLFIDTSGSYYNNVDRTNTLLRSLCDLEKKYPFFSFDLVTCQVGETLRSKKERFIRANGGNDLDDKIWDIFAKLQDKKSFNYNIALFDGNAFTDARGYDHEKNFGVFNNSKCSIISDDDNEPMIRKYAPQARSIIVSYSTRKSYAELLSENVLTCLQRALL